MNRRTKAFQKDFANWVSAMRRVLAAMPESERRELCEWERANLGGPAKLDTSDWPGWKKYIGEKPVYSDPIRAVV
jgi:hypothetical protein